MTYLFQEETVDVGLAVHGSQNLVGPIVFAAVFLPSSRANDILFRYDLHHSRPNLNQKRETLADMARYQRILSLNRSELGYLVRAFGPEQMSNILQGEGESTFYQIHLKMFKKLIKRITKKLSFRINKITFRSFRFISQTLWVEL